MTKSPSRSSRWTEIADHYRTQILSGVLAPGTKLPSNKELAGSWSTTTATVSRALGNLVVEKVLFTSPRGTFVADAPYSTPSASDRLARVHRTKSVLMEGETTVVTAAGLVVPPGYIAEMFQLDPGDQVVRRESVIGRGQTRVAFMVTWHPVEFVGLVPDLTSTDRAKAAGLTDRILEATGRRVTHGRDDMHARTADAREASNLGLPVGAPILGLGYRWSDEVGVIEFGEICLPPMLTIGYPYEPAD